MRLLRRSFAILALTLAFTAVSPAAWAQTRVDPVERDYKATEAEILTEVVIPGTPIEQRTEGFFRGKVGDLANYIEIIYNWLIGVVGLLTGTMLVVGGFQYLTAGGDKTRVQAAQGRMVNALIGMVLAFSAYFLLNTINPGLVNFKFPKIEQVKTELGVSPNCEQLQRSGTRVTPLVSDPDCGNLGEFMAGGEKQYCIYSGSCDLKQELLPGTSYHDSEVYVGFDVPFTDYHIGQDDTFPTGSVSLKTCFQYGVVPEQLAEAAKTKPNQKFAECLACAELSAFKVQKMGYGNKVTGDICKKWEDGLNSLPPSRRWSINSKDDLSTTVAQAKYPLGDIWTYCDSVADQSKCLQVDIYCKGITSCKGYERISLTVQDSPETATTEPDYKQCGSCTGGAWGQVKERILGPIAGAVGLFKSSSTRNHLLGFPVHLAGVCSFNPCRMGTDPRDPDPTDGCGYDSIVRFVNITQLGISSAMSECSGK